MQRVDLQFAKNLLDSLLSLNVETVCVCVCVCVRVCACVGVFMHKIRKEWKNVSDM